MKPFIGFIAQPYRYLYMALLANCIVIGIEMTIIGATLPNLLDQFSWSYTAAGAIIAAGSLGDFISSYSAGALLDRLGPKAVMMGGLILQGFALAFFATTPSVASNFILSILIGLGQGGVDVTINYAVARMQPPGESRPLGIIHSAYAVGSVVGPAITGLIIQAGLHWQSVFRAVAGVTALIGIIVLALPFRRIGETLPQPAPDGVAGKLSRQPLFYLSALILFLYVGLEFGISRWVGEYFVTILGTNAAIGAGMVSLFWTAILLGRIIVPGLFRKVAQSALLIGLALFASAAVAFSLLVKSPRLAAIGFFAAGLGCSAVYPLVITIIGQYFRESPGRAIGFAATGGAAGALVFPLVIAAVSQSVSLTTGFWVYVSIGFLMSAVATVIAQLVQRRKLMG